MPTPWWRALRRRPSGCSAEGLPCDQVDHRRHAAVTGSLVERCLVGLELADLERAERLAQQLLGVELAHLLRPAGAVLELRRRVAFDDDDAVRLQQRARA